MPVSKTTRKRDPEKNRAYVAAHYARKQAAIDELLEGVIIRVEPNIGGGKAASLTTWTGPPPTP